MMLQLEQVSKTYRRHGHTVQAMSGISLQLDQGSFVALRGPSGCGKTTVLLTAGGLLHPDSGQVTVAGQDPYAMTPDARAAFRSRTIGFVFQQFHLVPYLSVRDNVLAAALPGTGPADDAAGRTDELLDRFGLTAREQHLPGELSSGERQRTALARALLNGPQLLLADEPTGNLDPESARHVLSALQEFAEQGGAVLLVTHDDRAVGFARSVIHLAEGRLVESAAVAGADT